MSRGCSLLLLAIALIVIVNPFYATGLPSPDCGHRNGIYCRTEKFKDNFKRFFTRKFSRGLSERSIMDSYYVDAHAPPDKTLLHRLLVVPIIISNFIGTTPVHIPGMPVWIDPGSPEKSYYNIYNKFHRGDKK